MASKEKLKTGNRKSKMWSFPTVSLCPRCRGSQTRAMSTQGKVQYRKCMAPICQKRYTVIGSKVKRRAPRGVHGGSLSSSSSSSSA